MNRLADLRAAGIASAAAGPLAKVAPQILDGTAFYSRSESLVGHDGLPQTGGFVAVCGIETDPVARLVQLLSAAYAELIASLPDDIDRQARLVLHLGMPGWLAQVPALHASFAARMREAQLAMVGKVSFHFGDSAAGVAALDAAAAALQDGSVDMVLAGAVDSFLSPVILDARARAGLANTRGCPYAAIPGEAASIVLLQHQGASGRPPLARLRSIVQQPEPARSADPARGLVGATLARCLRTALGEADHAAVPGALVSDVNGARHRAEELGVVMTALAASALSDPLCPASALGEVGAATAPLYLALALYAPVMGSRFVLIGVSADSGLRAGLCLEVV